MSVKALDLEIPQGTSFPMIVTVRDALKIPSNITGYTFVSQIRPSYESSTVITSFIFTIQNQTTNTGEVRMELTPASLSGLVLTGRVAYVYDVEMTAPGGVVSRLLQGMAIITPEVTR